MNALVVYQSPVEAEVVQAPDERMLASLVRKVEEAEDASRIAREKAERDRDYLDGKQLTEAEHAALVARGQPPVAFNVIRDRVDFHQGMEKKQRRDPKAWPRNPEDQQSADAFTDGLRYVIDEADYSSKRSQAWKNITVEGCGGIEMWVVPNRDGNHDVVMARIPWDRLIFDPHSAEPDFSDANYIGQVVWKDVEDAVSEYVGRGLDEDDIRAKLEATMRPEPSTSNTYDDKPRDRMGWADQARKRVKIVILWCRHRGVWTSYDFTRGGILDQVESPYVDEDGESFCPIVLESCYVDRENNRYGVVRDYIDPQDEINKRRSKGMHLLTMQGVVADEGAVANVAEAKKQLKKPDFYISKQPGLSFEIVRNTELAAGQAQLLQSAMAYVANSGTNDALLGQTEGQSGKAIEAQQAGGLVRHADLMDTLRRFDWRVFRMAAWMMKQFWTAEKWIRVTDDELAPRWVGLNRPIPAMEQMQDPYTGEVIEQPMVDPYTGEPMIAGIENPVADLDVDIVVADAQDVITLTSEAYDTIAKMLEMVGKVPMPLLRAMVSIHPALNNRMRRQLLDTLEEMSKPDPAKDQAEAEQRAIAVEGAKAKIAVDRATARERLAKSEVAIDKAEQSRGVPMGAPQPQMPGDPSMGPMPPEGPPNAMQFAAE